MSNHTAPVPDPFDRFDAFGNREAYDYEKEMAGCSSEQSASYKDGILHVDGKSVETRENIDDPASVWAAE